MGEVTGDGIGPIQGFSDKDSAGGPTPDADSVDEFALSDAVHGSLSDLLAYHRGEINSGAVTPFLPMFLFRVGSKLSPADKWYFALLNKDQLRNSDDTIESYRNGENVEVISPEIMDMTLEQMLARHLFSALPEEVPAKTQVAYNDAFEVIYGKGAESPPSVRKSSGQKRILYNLQPNPNKQNEIELSSKAGDCLSYVRLKHEQSGGQYGAITIDLSYALTGKGGD